MIFTLPVDIYKTFVVVAIEPSEEEWLEYVSKNDDFMAEEYSE